MYRDVLLLVDFVLLIGAAHLLYLASLTTWLVLLIAALLIALCWFGRNAIRRWLQHRLRPIKIRKKSP
jgi:hypothetical protein